MFSKTYFWHFNSTNLWILFYYWILLFLLLLLNRCQTCGDSFTRYSEQNSQFLLLFRMLFMKVKKQQNCILLIIFLRLIQSFLATSDDLLAFFRRYLLQSHAMTVHQVQDDLNSQIFGQKLFYTFSFSYHLVQYFTNVNIVVCLIKNWQAQPLKYKCKRCKGDRFRKEFETQVIEIDIEF